MPDDADRKPDPERLLEETEAAFARGDWDRLNRLRAYARSLDIDLVALAEAHDGNGDTTSTAVAERPATPPAPPPDPAAQLAERPASASTPFGGALEPRRPRRTPAESAPETAPTAGAPAAPVDATCSWLHVGGDRATHALFPTDAHRCGASSSYVPSVAYQQRYCLSDRHTACPQYLAAGRARSHWLLGRLRGRAGVAAAAAAAAVVVVAVSAAVVFTSDDSSEGSTPPPAAAATEDDATPSGAVAGASETPTATATATASPAATATTTATPEATATEQPAPIVTTTAPTSTPDTSNLPVYIVQPGDTLAAIANAYAVDINALLAVNGLTLDSIIEVGQQLFIPDAPLGQ